MPRKARIKEEHAYYHIYNRGDNKEDIFIDNEDKLAFIDRLRRYIHKYDFILLAYCIMTNHFHLLIHSNGANISEMMKGLTLSYGHYFRKKYERCGHLVQNRFRSELLDTSASVIIESMYIHSNPIKAQLVKAPEDYEWSSMSYYLGGTDSHKILDNSRIMAMLGVKKHNCIKSYIESINQYIKDNGYGTQIKSIFSNSDDYDYIYENIEKNVVHRNYSLHAIIEIVAHKNNTNACNIVHRFSRKYKDAKKACIYLLCLLCNMSYSEVGKVFKLSASAVGYNIRSFLDRLEVDIDIKKQLEYYTKLIA